jgi:hypothetical protein
MRNSSRPPKCEIPLDALCYRRCWRHLRRCRSGYRNPCGRTFLCDRLPNSTPSGIISYDKTANELCLHSPKAPWLPVRRWGNYLYCSRGQQGDGDPGLLLPVLGEHAVHILCQPEANCSLSDCHTSDSLSSEFALLVCEEN